MSETMEAVTDAISEGADGVYKAAEKSAGKLGARVSEASEVLRDAASRTGRAMGRGYDRLSEKAHDLEAGVAEEIQDWPMSSVLIALGVGVAVGYLLRGGFGAKPRRSRR